jgi:hypothetical protein
MDRTAFWSALVGGGIAVVVQLASLFGQNRLEAQRHQREMLAAKAARDDEASMRKSLEQRAQTISLIDRVVADVQVFLEEGEAIAVMGIGEAAAERAERFRIEVERRQLSATSSIVAVDIGNSADAVYRKWGEYAAMRELLAEDTIQAENNVVTAGARKALQNFIAAARSSSSMYPS